MSKEKAPAMATEITVKGKKTMKRGMGIAEEDMRRELRLNRLRKNKRHDCKKQLNFASRKARRVFYFRTKIDDEFLFIKNEFEKFFSVLCYRNFVSF